MKERPWNFSRLYQAERETLGEESGPGVESGKPSIAAPGGAGEPWVAFTPDDRVGVALSGGGLRSATFNLGLLQALHDKGVLEYVDYLATVSGGGYIGGFWTRWRKGRPAEVFPEREPAELAGGATGAERVAAQEIREPAEIRHLREFSRFLIPRRGLNAEFWGAAVTVLSGLVPAMLISLSVVFLLMMAWAYLAAWMLVAGTHAAQAEGFWTGRFFGWDGVIFGAVAALFVLVLEGGQRSRERSWWWCVLWAGVVMAAACAGWGLWNLIHPAPAGDPFLNLGGEEGETGVFHLNTFVFGPIVMLGGPLILLAAVRLIGGRASGTGLPTRQRLAFTASLERVMGRVLALQVAWAALAVIWELARWLDIQSGNSPACVSGAGGLTAVLAFVFYKVQHWLAQEAKAGSDDNSTWLKWLKPWAPQLLANSVIVLLLGLAALVALTGAVHAGEVWPRAWLLIIIAVSLIVLGLFLFNPPNFGLHEFYRARLTRCYLGASHPKGASDRASAELVGDDMLLAEDEGKPIHLICCTANHLWGDLLGTLHRGGRSAVLSRHGVALGNRCVPDGRLRLSAAMTASAAAFNSLMGEWNIELGRSVAFVMTALNLRLGLWVGNPWCGQRAPGMACLFRALPGLFHFKEMFGWSQCRIDRHASAFMHLSDGGHFENLAVYELVRRHCRYILVADAGEDVEFAFSDLGRAVRRVREDFGVEIEIDLTPLRPGADQLSSHHVVVGTIHYDGVAGTDKGTIVYCKPTLTGDEPPDVLQYHQRKPKFPHESTGDQFFDEAQWESYRRLGLHIGHQSLPMVEKLPARVVDPSIREKHKENLFREMRLHWQNVPWLQGDGGARLCEHATALEEFLCAPELAVVRREFVLGPLVAGAGATSKVDGASATGSPEPTDRLALLAIRTFKLMEEAWFVCELSAFWSHPRASSWMSYLHRWAATPTLRRWWPLVKTLFGENFQSFAQARLGLPSAKGGGQVDLRLGICPAGDKHGYAWQRLGEGRRDRVRAEQTLWFCLELALPEIQNQAIQIGLAAIEVVEFVANWEVEDVFIPPELRGGGFSGRFLDEIVAYFTKYAAGRPKFQLRVLFRQSQPVQDQAGRQELVELIDFYKSRGFKYESAAVDVMVKVIIGGVSTAP